MTLYVKLQILTGSDPLDETWKITNVGHPTRGGHPEGDDLRKYEIECITNHPENRPVYVCTHRRSDGARTLVAVAMRAIHQGEQLRIRERQRARDEKSV